MARTPLGCMQKLAIYLGCRVYAPAKISCALPGATVIKVIKVSTTYLWHGLQDGAVQGCPHLTAALRNPGDSIQHDVGTLLVVQPPYPPNERYLRQSQSRSAHARRQRSLTA